MCLTLNSKPKLLCTDVTPWRRHFDFTGPKRRNQTLERVLDGNSLPGVSRVWLGTG